MTRRLRQIRDRKSVNARTDVVPAVASTSFSFFFFKKNESTFFARAVSLPFYNGHSSEGNEPKPQGVPETMRVRRTKRLYAARCSYSRVAAKKNVQVDLRISGSVARVCLRKVSLRQDAFPQTYREASATRKGNPQTEGRRHF